MFSTICRNIVEGIQHFYSPEKASKVGPTHNTLFYSYYANLYFANLNNCTKQLISLSSVYFAHSEYDDYIYS